MLPVVHFISTFIQSHTAVVGLFGLSAVVSMREELPTPFNKVPLFVWLYGWLHDTLNTFVSRKAGIPKP